MDIKEFINEYKEANNKEAFIKKHIVVDYVPYAEKVTICSRVILESHYRDGDIILNSPKEYYRLMLYIIKRYVDFDFDIDVASFDELQKHGLITDIINLLPGTEFTVYSELINMCRDDFNENYRSTIATMRAISTKFEKMLGEIDE